MVELFLFCLYHALIGKQISEGTKNFFFLLYFLSHLNMLVSEGHKKVSWYFELFLLVPHLEMKVVVLGPRQ